MENLKIIGTSHISAESVNSVKNYIAKYKPDIVALELDHARLHALLEEKRKGPGLRDIGRLGVQGFLFALIGGWVQKKLGKYTGVMPGSEMKAAFIEAKNHNLKVALIDQQIEITLRRFSKELTWKEKFRIIGDILEGIFFGKRQMKKLGIGFDIEKVPEKKIVKILMKLMKKRYPNIYKVLVEERNEVMARNLATIMMQNPGKRILAVVGAGHEEEIERIVEKLVRKEDGVGYSYTVSIKQPKGLKSSF